MNDKIFKRTIEEKEKEVHTLRVRVKDLVSEVSVLRVEIQNLRTKLGVQSDFGYDLVSENPDALHIEKNDKL
jgi:regulator of replication initiation timing